MTASPMASLPFSPETSKLTHDPSIGTVIVFVVSPGPVNRSRPSGFVRTTVEEGRPAPVALILHLTVCRCAGWLHFSSTKSSLIAGVSLISISIGGHGGGVGVGVGLGLGVGV